MVFMRIGGLIRLDGWSGWIGYRLFFTPSRFFFHSCLSDSGVYDGERKNGMLGMRGFSVFCFLYYWRDVSPLLYPSLFFVAFFDPQFPFLPSFPLLDPPSPSPPYLLVVSLFLFPGRTLTMCFIFVSYCYQDFLPVALVEGLGAYERCEAML